MLSRSIFRPAQALRLAATPYQTASRLSVASRSALRLRSSAFAPVTARGRFYSSEAEIKKESQADKAAETKEGEKEENPLEKKLEAKEKEVIDLKDKYLRSVADFRNLQERTARDIAAAKSFALTSFLRDLLEPIDNLDRALAATPAAALAPEADNAPLRDLHGGLQMSEAALMRTLAKHGLERFDPSAAAKAADGSAAGASKFDPNLHEASFMAKDESKEDGTVMATVQKGYRLNGRVIRAAKVGVVKNS